VIFINREIHELEQRIAYKYLGSEESKGIQHQQRLKKEYTKRSRTILKSNLNAKDKITAVGALAIPILKYSLGIIHWILK
jgi:hypothetical protein